jgi:hypothetical protein
LIEGWIAKQHEAPIAPEAFAEKSASVGFMFFSTFLPGEKKFSIFKD